MGCIMNRAKSILIVDDEKDVADFLANFFRKKGYAVFTAYCGQEAIQQAKVLRPTLMILDLVLTDMCGSEVASQLLSYSPLNEMQVIFMTGKLVEFEKETVNVTGSRYLLKKPFETSEIEEVVHKLIGPPSYLKPAFLFDLIHFFQNLRLNHLFRNFHL